MNDEVQPDAPQTMGQQFGRRSWAEPWKIKMVEPIKMTTREERERAIREAGYNTFLLRSEDVYIDLLTDSGTSAMSDRQWAGMMLGDEAYAGSRNFYHLEANVQKYYGYKYVVPTHQGRGAEHLISRALIEPGDIIPGNMYFTTTRAHQELQGGTFVDVIIDEAHDPQNEHPFKGNIDLDKLQAVIDKHGAEKIPYVSLAGTVNMAGGQPVSMENVRAGARAVRPARDQPVPRRDAHGGERLLHPGARAGLRGQVGRRDPEGVLLVHRRRVDEREEGQPGQHRRLARGQQPGRVRRSRANWVVVFEGLHTYGGMAGRDMEALAIGIEEQVQDDHMRSRIGQVRYLGELLDDWGVPIVRPIGGHAIFLDAKRFYPHMPQDEFPAQTLAAELYLDSGIRAMERGIVSAGRNPQTGDHNRPKLELVRLTIPRRVYTQAHMDVTAEAVKAVYDGREGTAACGWCTSRSTCASSRRGSNDCSEFTSARPWLLGPRVFRNRATPASRRRSPLSRRQAHDPGATPC